MQSHRKLIFATILAGALMQPAQALDYDYLCVDPLLDPDFEIVCDELMAWEHCLLGFNPSLVAAMPKAKKMNKMKPVAVAGGRFLRRVARAAGSPRVQNALSSWQYANALSYRPSYPIYDYSLKPAQYNWSQFNTPMQSNVHGYSIMGTVRMRTVIQLY